MLERAAVIGTPALSLRLFKLDRGFFLIRA
jgi:hypothetical protein